MKALSDLRVLRSSKSGLPISPRVGTGPMERVGPDEKTFDYCLRQYEPVAPPGGKLASVNALYETFAVEGVEAEGRAVVQRLRSEFGASRTVWGVKHRGAGQPLAWELYFYDHERPGPKLSLETITEILRPELAIDAKLDRPVDWLMFSVEFSADMLRSRTVPGVTLYVKGEDLSFDLRGREFSMGNLYRFFDPKMEIQNILNRINQSVHFDPDSPALGQIIPPRLLRSYHICVANKARHDGVYFSRAAWEGLSWLIDAFAWPAAVRRFLASHAAELDYLLWDVGFDFRLLDGTLRREKSGFYGYF